MRSILFSLFLSASFATVARADCPQMADLGTLTGLGSSAATAINVSGQVAGFSYAAGDLHAFLWTAQGGMKDLGTGVASGINNLGQVVGVTGNWRPFLWTAQGGKQDLGWLPGYESAILAGIPFGPAMAINDLGQVVGSGYAG